MRGKGEFVLRALRHTIDICAFADIYTPITQVLQWKREFEETRVRAARVGASARSASPPSGAAGFSLSFSFSLLFSSCARPQRIAEQRRSWFSLLFSAGNCFSPFFCARRRSRTPAAS
jgi:hypothetical protein